MPGLPERHNEVKTGPQAVQVGREHDGEVKEVKGRETGRQLTPKGRQEDELDRNDGNQIVKEQDRNLKIKGKLAANGDARNRKKRARKEENGCKGTKYNKGGRKTVKFALVPTKYDPEQATKPPNSLKKSPESSKKQPELLKKVNTIKGPKQKATKPAANSELNGLSTPMSTTLTKHNKKTSQKLPKCPTATNTRQPAVRRASKGSGPAPKLAPVHQCIKPVPQKTPVHYLPSRPWCRPGRRMTFRQLAAACATSFDPMDVLRIVVPSKQR